MKHVCRSRYCPHTPAFERLLDLSFTELEKLQKEVEGEPESITDFISNLAKRVPEATHDDINAVQWAVVRMK